MKKLCFSIQLVIISSIIIFSQTEWEYIGLADPNIGEIFDIEIDADGNIYAGTLLGPIYKSTDNGVTWELKNNGLPSNAAIGEDIAINNNQIYLVTNQGLYKTNDGANNWFRIAQSIPFTDFDMVSIIPNGYIFTSAFNMGTGGLFRSTDEGVTWEATSFTGFGALDVGINKNGVMFFGVAALTYHAIYRSFDLGMTWEMLEPRMGTDALEYLNDGSVLAGVQGNGAGTLPPGIYKTTNNGDSWFNTNTFSGFNIFPDFVLDTNDDVYVTNGEVYLSINNGGSWEYRGLANLDVFCLTIDSSGYLYAGTLNNGIFKTPGRTTPVELTSFSAFVNERNVELSWITATELNNAGFEVERISISASPGQDWAGLAFVLGRGTTTESTAYNYIDKNLSAGSYNYRIKQIDYDGSYQYYNLKETVEISNQFNFTLEQNYPNPFNPTTTISYSIPVNGIVTLKVFDALGNEVRFLVSEEQEAGYYKVEFNAEGLSSGIYFYKLSVNQVSGGNFNSTMKMMIIK